MPPVVPQPPFDISGKYHVEEILGYGGMGVVYRARQDPLNRRVAIKMILGDLNEDEDFVARFKQEAVTVAHLSHSGIVQIHDVVEHEGQMCIVMEFVRGRTLDDMLKQEGVTGPQALEICAEICDALHFCHKRGIIHRDIKPENVMFVEDGPLKLMDFGIAKAHDSPLKTQTGTALGTPKYMSPEQAQGLKTIDARSDIYSLGCVLYEMLAGRVPFEGEQSLAIAIAHVREAPQPVRAFNTNVPSEVEALVLRCLAKVPNERPQDMSALAGELRDLAARWKAGRIGGDTEDATALVDSDVLIERMQEGGELFAATTTRGSAVESERATVEAGQMPDRKTGAWNTTRGAAAAAEQEGDKGGRQPSAGQKSNSISVALPSNPRSFVALYGVLLFLIVLIGGVGIYLGREHLMAQNGGSNAQPTPTPSPTATVTPTPTPSPTAAPSPTPSPTPAGKPAAYDAIEQRVVTSYNNWFANVSRQLPNLGATSIGDPGVADLPAIREGAEILEAGLIEAPDSPLILKNLGEHYLRLGRKDRARQYLEQLRDGPYSTPEDRVFARRRLDNL